MFPSTYSFKYILGFYTLPQQQELIFSAQKANKTSKPSQASQPISILTISFKSKQHEDAPVASLI